MFQYWYGDPGPFATEISRFTLKLMKEEPKVDGVHLSAPHDFEKPNHFDLCRRRIRSLGASKSLIAKNCPSLLNRLGALPKDQDSGEFPAVTALGGTICSLTMSTPWAVRIQGGGTDGSWEEYALSEGAIWSGKGSLDRT